MSYARWGWNGSDVYVYATDHDSQAVIACCGCRYTEKVLETPFRDRLGIVHQTERNSFYADKRNRMIEHLWQHKKDGDTVLDETLQDLIFDFPDGEKLVDEYFKERDANG